MSSPEARKLFGPLLIGAFLNAILYGVFLMQHGPLARHSRIISLAEGKGKFINSTKTLSTNSHSNKVILSQQDALSVLFLLILETINTGLDFGIIWEPLIETFGDSRALQVQPILLASDPIMTAIISTIVQVFFALRTYRMTKSKVLLSTICALAFCSLVGAVTSTAFIATSLRWDHFPVYRGPILTWLLASALCDIVISISLVGALYKGKGSFKSTNSLINKIILLTVQTGTITSVAAIGDALTFLFVLNSHTTIQFIWDFSLSKLYSNSLLSTLNARSEWNRYLNDANSRPDRSFCHIEGLEDWMRNSHTVTDSNSWDIGSGTHKLLEMSAYPAFLMGGLCAIGGVTGFARTRSIPSLVAGLGVGALYLWSADSIRKGTANGIEGALGASAILFLSSLPRARKGPVPATLTVTATASAIYYGRLFLQMRE
ncbi:hypothetical protein Moror_17345 [Moniliophthora roreri MCA 2997]|uniref:DUF6534 domain-containing protein n=1 Tax=Moniliophthora roreri (strain MCA 2997) TaxID=1381753 RepID=V2XZ32_MONRO|nr:hypothetical protein Moror_17345 [Moniliophthora roreri MCA 2997]